MPTLPEEMRAPASAERLREIFAPKPGQTPGLFQASAVVFPIAAVYLYFTGYLFCYFYYYQGFGVTLESLDLSPQFYFVRAYTCLRSVEGICLVLVFLAVVAVYLRGWLRSSLMLLAMLAAFPLLVWISYTTALAQHLSNFCNTANTVRFHFKDAPASGTAETPASPYFGAVTPRQLSALAESGQLSLLLETKDRIVVFRKPDCYPVGDSGPMAPPRANVYTLLRSDLDFTNVMP